MTVPQCRTICLACCLILVHSISLLAQDPGSNPTTIAELQQRIESLELQSQADLGTAVQTSGGAGWVGSFDILAWTVRDAGFEYGITDIGGVQDRGAVGTVLSLGGNYSPGFRFSAGKRLGDGGPVIGFGFLNFVSNDAQSEIGPIRATVVSADNSENDDSDNINTLGVQTITPDDRATRADALFDFSMRHYDFQLEQSFRMSDALTTKLTSAIRITDVDSTQQVTYLGGDFQTAFTPFQTSAFDGAGAVLGGEMSWNLSRRISFNFSANGGALLGRMQTRTFIPDDEPGVPTDVTYDETRLVPLLESRVWLMTRGRLGMTNIEFGGGYEFANLFNVADQRVFTESHMEGQNAHIIGDLSLDGFFGRITFTR